MAEEKQKEKTVEESAVNTNETPIVEHGEDFDISALAKKLGVDEQYIVDDLHMTALEKEQNPWTKSDLSDTETIIEKDGVRLDKLEQNQSVDISDGTLTGNEDGTVHCKSEYLGEFDYNPEEFAYGYKEVKEKDGTVSQLPILTYIGDDNGVSNVLGIDTRMTTITIPDGIKSCDYMFEGNDKLEYAPRMPDSVETAHYMYANCSKLDGHTREAKDGESWLDNSGGSVHLSPKLKDMSGMYKNCAAMESDFGTLPESVVNIKECWDGCEGMHSSEKFLFWTTHTYSVPEFGGEKTPYLTSQFAKDALNNISDETVKETADSAEYMVNNDGTVNQEKKEAYEKENTLDEDTLSHTQSMNGLQHEEGIASGNVSSEVEIASNGSRSKNKVYDASTNSYIYDETGELKSDVKDSAPIWQRFVIDGAVGLGIGGLAGSLTNSKWVGLAAGLGGAVLLDQMDVLPKSFSPILKWTAGLLPEGSAKDKLNELANELSGSQIDAQLEELTPEKVAEMHQSGRLEDSFKGAGSVMIQDVSKSMQVNGYAAASSMALWSTASKGEDSAKCVADTIKQSTDAMESQWSSEVGEQGPTDEQKTEMKEYYDKMFQALDSYNQGAKKGISDTFGNDATKEQLSEYGLNMVNRAYAGTVMDSLLKMNEQYSFMTQEELQTLTSKYQFDGVGDLSTYQDSSSFDVIRQDEQLDMDALSAVDTLPEESSSEKETSSTTTHTSSSGREHGGGGGSFGTPEKTTESESKESTKTNRGAQAEEAFGHITEKTNTPSLEME